MGLAHNTNMTSTGSEGIFSSGKHGGDMRHKGVARFHAWISAIPFMVCLTSTSLVHGEAFRNLHQGTAAAGQGDAFAAQADDPSAIFYNPAGMTQLRGIPTVCRHPDSRRVLRLYHSGRAEIQRESRWDDRQSSSEFSILNSQPLQIRHRTLSRPFDRNRVK